jgi:hypothetical protein
MAYPWKPFYIRKKMSLMKKSKFKKLGQLAATAICGNDITSSCLYVSALAIFYAGKWGPLALVIVSLVVTVARRMR